MRRWAHQTSHVDWCVIEYTCTYTSLPPVCASNVIVLLQYRVGMAITLASQPIKENDVKLCDSKFLHFLFLSLLNLLHVECGLPLIMKCSLQSLQGGLLSSLGPEAGSGHTSLLGAQVTVSSVIHSIVCPSCIYL